MSTINIEQFIDSNRLDVKHVAQTLFPNNKYPDAALERILTGESELNAAQVSTLAAMAGVPINNLFSRQGWAMEPGRAKLIFTKGDYTAVLNQRQWITHLYYKVTPFSVEVLHKPSIPLSEYLDQLNLLIAQHELSLKPANDGEV